MPNDELSPPLKFYSPKDLCNFYGITWPTLKKNLKTVPNLGERVGSLYSPEQVKKIFEHLGAPSL